MQERDVVRLFLALWPDAALRARLGGYRDAWRWPAGARPVPDASLHLTLHFIGDFARARIDALAARLGTVTPETIALKTLGAEVWRGGIAVLRVEAEPRLAALHARLGVALAGLGVPLDPRPFSPHVTLARKARQAEPSAAEAGFIWHASGFALVESVRGARVPYEVLRTFGDS